MEYITKEGRTIGCETCIYYKNGKCRFTNDTKQCLRGNDLYLEGLKCYNKYEITINDFDLCHDGDIDCIYVSYNSNIGFGIVAITEYLNEDGTQSIIIDDEYMSSDFIEELFVQLIRFILKHKIWSGKN